MNEPNGSKKGESMLLPRKSIGSCPATWAWVSAATLLLLPVLALLACTGCNSRSAGQVEILSVSSDGRLANYSATPAPPATRTAIPQDGDPVRSNDDIVTFQIESAYLQSVPSTLTGSHDIVIFADVWENAAMGYMSPASLTTIVYVGPNELIPSRLNFRDAIAYGPTRFKGHPLRVRFTVMVLQ